MHLLSVLMSTDMLFQVTINACSQVLPDDVEAEFPGDNDMHCAAKTAICFTTFVPCIPSLQSWYTQSWVWVLVLTAQDLVSFPSESVALSESKIFLQTRPCIHLKALESYIKTLVYQDDI